MIFDVKNWLWMSNFHTFWHLPITPIPKIQWFHLTTDDFYPKTFLILNPFLKTPQPVLPYLSILGMWFRPNFWWGKLVIRKSLTCVFKYVMCKMIWKSSYHLLFRFKMLDIIWYVFSMLQICFYYSQQENETSK